MQFALLDIKERIDKIARNRKEYLGYFHFEKPFCNSKIGHCQKYKPPDAGLTLSLCSLRLMMTAVICWSIKMRMVQSKAGSAATSSVHQGFPPNGSISQPLFFEVGCREKGRGQATLSILGITLLFRIFDDVNIN